MFVWGWTLGPRGDTQALGSKLSPSEAWSVGDTYSRDDQDAVAELVAALNRAGFSIRWDGEIPPGEDFRSFVDRKLNGAPAICVVCTGVPSKGRNSNFG